MSSLVPLVLPPGLQQALRTADLSFTSVPLLPFLKESPATAGFTFRTKRVWIPRECSLWEDGDVQRHLYLREVLTGVAEEVERPKVSEFGCPVSGCSLFFDTLEGFEHHYNTLHRNVCSFCKRSFPSGHLLDVHILEWHDSLFQILSEKHDMYQCLVEGCQLKFKTSRDRKDHLVTVHLYPSDFRFDKPKIEKSQVKLSQSPQKPNLSVSMEVTPEEMTDMDITSAESTCDATRLTSVGCRTVNYKHRIPSTICFGQGAVRGFKSTKKKK
ncbi:zinc finger protein 511 [Ambystoma mexicanum]|uniref:zinc finger protein 511 n=1 Tax=Ambystoma mexicanum TaxID=8296 RepID=UPI0037E76669